MEKEQIGGKEDWTKMAWMISLKNSDNLKLFLWQLQTKSSMALSLNNNSKKFGLSVNCKIFIQCRKEN